MLLFFLFFFLLFLSFVSHCFVFFSVSSFFWVLLFLITLSIFLFLGFSVLFCDLFLPFFPFLYYRSTPVLLFYVSFCLCFALIFRISSFYFFFVPIIFVYFFNLNPLKSITMASIIIFKWESLVKKLQVLFYPPYYLIVIRLFICSKQSYYFEFFCFLNLIRQN